MNKVCSWFGRFKLALAGLFAFVVGSVSAELPAGAPPGALDGFDLDTIGTSVAPVVADIVTALGVIFGLLFSIVVIRFTWKYVRSAFR